jgi:ubiquinone/menaquinone biosynthesis C-methylase UbiE
MEKHLMPHKFDAARLACLMSPERRQELPPDEVLRQTGLSLGQTLVDIGAGPGFFSLPAARLVGPKGRVIGLDVSPVMLAALRKNARAAKLANIRAVRIAENAPALPPAAAVYLIVNTFHEFDDPAAYLAALRRAMTAESRLVIVDFFKKKTASGPPIADRIPLSRMRDLLRSAGFEIIRTFRANENEYGIVSRKRS